MDDDQGIKNVLNLILCWMGFLLKPGRILMIFNIKMSYGSLFLVLDVGEFLEETQPIEDQ